MPDALVPTDDAIDRVVAMLRARLKSAFTNGQRVRLTAREGASGRVPLSVFEHAPVSDLLKAVESDGSYELHVYIEPKR